MCACACVCIYVDIYVFIHTPTHPHARMRARVFSKSWADIIVTFPKFCIFFILLTYYMKKIS